MRCALLLGSSLLLTLTAGCTPSRGDDAGQGDDGGQGDAGVQQFTCGDQTCSGGQYCSTFSGGACMLQTGDAGSCPEGYAPCSNPGEPLACSQSSVGCADLPVGCASCDCLEQASCSCHTMQNGFLQVDCAAP